MSLSTSETPIAATATKAQSSVVVMRRVVTLHTNFGDLSMELYDEYAPSLCQNFWELAQTGRYNGSRFHRLIPGCLLQGGDVGRDGRGGDSARGGYLSDEASPKLRHTGAGIVSSASAGPDVNASQFFITLSPQPKFDGKFSIFARLSFGMDVLQRMAAVESDRDFVPLQLMHITHCSTGTYPQQRRPAAAINGQQKRPRGAMAAGAAPLLNPVSPSSTDPLEASDDVEVMVTPRRKGSSSVLRLIA